MGRQGDRARTALLDAAEELFALHGVDSISNRRIAEHAGQANHSAVAYHFGTRDDLVRALVRRHAEQTAPLRRALADGLDDDASLHDVLVCLILPSTDVLAGLGAPTWRARMLRQVASTPSTADALGGSVGDPTTEELIARTSHLLSDLSPSVRSGRSALIGRMVIDTCADYEERVESGAQPPHWTAFGYFLTDACAGMLSAPVTHPEEFDTLVRPATIW